MASAIMMSFCGVLNTQRFLASCGSMMAAEAPSEIIGVLPSATASIMASEAGVVDEPKMTSTFSDISLRALVTAPVVSDPSSSTT